MSLDELFYVGHRYEVKKMRTQTSAIPLSQLNAENYIPFLFRAAYMFDELRGPVIKIGVKTCGNRIGKWGIHDLYRDHPEYSDIMGELFEAHHEYLECIRSIKLVAW